MGKSIPLIFWVELILSSLYFWREIILPPKGAVGLVPFGWEGVNLPSVGRNLNFIKKVIPSFFNFLFLLGQGSWAFRKGLERWIILGLNFI